MSEPLYLVFRIQNNVSYIIYYTQMQTKNNIPSGLTEISSLA